MSDPSEYWFDRSTLQELCSLLSMSDRGLSDPISADERTSLVQYLKHRLEVWQTSPFARQWRAYDDAVKQLVEAALTAAGEL